MLKRRTFLLSGSALGLLWARQAQALFSPIGIAGLVNRQAPTIISMVPNNGPAIGGTAVSFIGCSFSGITGVTFGGVPATNIVITNNDVMTCVSPSNVNGLANVVLTNPVGPSIPIVFTYGSPPTVSSILPPSGPVAGGTSVQIGGSGFTGATAVNIGGPAAAIVVVDDGHITCTTPPGTGVADVVVTNANGSGTLTGGFTYTGTFSASIPLGGGAFTAQQRGGSGGPIANADGTTTGFQSGGLWTILQTWVNFPSDDVYKFVIPAFCSAFTAAPANALGIFIDQLMIPADTGTTANKNWFIQFVNNPAPSQNYSYTAPVKAGLHSIQVYMSYTNQSSGTGAAENNVHGDRLNINSTGAGLPAEPSPQTRNPALFPYSSNHFLNTPFGANAQWLALNAPAAQSINGTGGNGAHISINAASFSSNVWVGQATDPVWTLSTNDVVQFPTSPVSTPIPVRCPAGAYQSLDNADQNNAMIDGTNPRYHYSGLGANAANRNMPFFRVLIGDNYNLNHAVPQSAGQFAGIIRVADLDSGTIAHRLVAGLGFSNGTTTGYAPASQTSQWSGMPWPACESDAAWKSSNEYVNPNGVPYGSVAGIPPGIAKPGGLNAATSMMWDCLQNYGVFFNITSGTYPQMTVYAEGGANNHPLLAGVNWSTIVPNLSVMTPTSQAPIVVGQGLGGGAPRVALLPGITQGLPSIGQSPYSIPTSPAGIPIQAASARPGTALPSGTNSGTSGAAGQGKTAGVTIPVGSTVIVALALDRAAATSFVSPFNDSAGNSYTVIQPAAASDQNPAFAICLSTTVQIANGTFWAPTLSPGGLANYYFMGAYYLLKPATGSITLRTSNSATTTSSVNTLSTTLAGVQAGDLVLGFIYTSNYAKITDPVGMGSLNPTPPVSISFVTAPTTGTFTYNPTWNNASPVALVAAAFSIGTGGSAPTVSTIADDGTSAASGSTAGNRPVTITGTNFVSGATVTIGSVAAVSVTVPSGTQIKCRTGPHAAAANVAVAVTTSNGTGSANLYTYTLGGLTAPAPATTAPASYNTLSFQDEFTDLLGIDTTLTKQPGFNFYPQSYGWTSAGVFANSSSSNSAAIQTNLLQYYSPIVSPSILRMIGHVAPQPDTSGALNSTVVAANAQGYTGTVVLGANGFYIETRCAGEGTTSNSLWFIDQRALTGANQSTFLEWDIPELFTGNVCNFNIIQWNGQNRFASGNPGNFVLDNNFHVYGTLYVPPAQAGGNGFVKFYVDGSLKVTVAVTTGSAIATIMATQQIQFKLLTDPNTNSNPFQIDYIRVWQQTPTG